MPSYYSKKIFRCPFYTSNAVGEVRCEGGRINFINKELSEEYFDSFCASYDWQKCSIASSLVRFYENTNAIEPKKRRYLKLGE